MRKMVLAVITLTAFLSLIPIGALQAACYPDNNNSPCEGNFDRDCDVDGSDAALFKTDFGRSPFSNPCPPSGNAMVPKTGQTTSYATGDDGDLEKGVLWPIPRFTDNGNGTVTDNLTGLIWLKNADCVGPQTWDYALAGKQWYNRRGVWSH